MSAGTRAGPGHPLGVQALLAMLLVDERARRRFAIDPAAVAAPFGLSAQEVDQAVGAIGQGFELAARGVTGKRVRRLRTFFPCSFALLDGLGLGSGLARAFCQEIAPTWRAERDEDGLATAHRFVAFAVATGLPGAPACTVDLLRYELLRLELTLAAARLARTGRATPPPGPAGLDPAARPVLAVHVRVAAYRYDVLDLAGWLRRRPRRPGSAAARTLPAEPTRVVVVQAPGSRAPAVYRIPLRLHELLTRCDGTSTVAELTEPDGAAGLLQLAVDRGLVEQAPGLPD